MAAILSRGDTLNITLIIIFVLNLLAGHSSITIIGPQSRYSTHAFFSMCGPAFNLRN